MLINHFLGVFFRAFSSVYNKYEFTGTGHYWTRFFLLIYLFSKSFITE